MATSRRDRGGSPLLLVGAALAVIVLGAVAIAAGVPAGPVLVFGTGVGATMLVRAAGIRTQRRSEELAPGALDVYPLRFPAQRWKVGSPWQFRFVPSSRREWAPGVLGVRYGEARFVPSRAGLQDRAWTGRPTSVEVIKTLQVCAVRFHAPDGGAQFSIQLPADEVRAQLAPLLPVTGAAKP